MRTMTQQEFGEWFKQLRVDSGMIQKQMANILSLNTSQYISQIENGDTKLPKHAYDTLIKHFRLDRSKFIEMLVAIERDRIEKIFSR